MNLQHYNKAYFNWQKEIGIFGGKANLFKFADEVDENDSVIDFGCGGGYLLANIMCRDKIGIEINEAAKKHATSLHLNIVADAEEIEDEWADVIVSNHALEHVLGPYDELIKLYKKVKPGGKIVFIVPLETKYRYRPDDINQHLYAWSPMCLGNLFSKVGFNVKSVEIIRHAWYLKYYYIEKFFGKLIYNIVCKLTAIVLKKLQLKIIAYKNLKKHESGSCN